MSEGPPQVSGLPPLEYQRRPPLAWVSRHRGLLIFTALCAAITVSIYQYRQPLKYRVLWLYWSHQAAAHVMPKAMEISVIGPQASQLATTNPDYLPHSPFARIASTLPSASYNPVAFRELTKLDGRLRSMKNPNGPVIFMGTIHRPDGTPRLVIITGASERDSRYMIRSVGVAVLPLPGWFDSLPQSMGTTMSGPVIMISSGPPPAPAEYRTGLADPKNPSRVIIGYVVRESMTMIMRAHPGIRLEEAANRSPQIAGDGEIYADLGNDDALAFTIHGPGQLSVTSLSGDPQILEAAAQLSQKLRVFRPGIVLPALGPTTHNVRPTR